MPNVMSYVYFVLEQQPKCDDSQIRLHKPICMDLDSFQLIEISTDETQLKKYWYKLA